MKQKPQRVVQSKTLSGPDGVYDVSFGPATVERRAEGDYSKEGIPAPDHSSLDDYKEREERWNKKFGMLP